MCYLSCVTVAADVLSEVCYSGCGCVTRGVLQWLRMYSLSKLKLDLNKLVSGPDCRHVSQTVKALHKVVDARYWSLAFGG